MKGVLMIGLCFLWAGAVAAAEILYVSDLNEITFRTGPGIDHKITAMLKSGQPLVLQESAGDWSRVLLQDGREGWVLTRFTNRDLPSSLQLDRLRSEHETLKSQAEGLIDRNQRLTAEAERLNAELVQTQQDLTRTRQELESLRAESADFFELKKRFDDTAAQLAEKSHTAESRENEIHRLELNRNIWWFLSGAGVLFLGVIIGFTARRQRRRSTLL